MKKNVSKSMKGGAFPYNRGRVGNSELITNRDLTTLRVSFDIGGGRRSRNMNYTNRYLKPYKTV